MRFFTPATRRASYFVASCLVIAGTAAAQSRQRSDLPWNRPNGPPPVPLRESESVADQLARFGIDPEQWEPLTDGQSLAEPEVPVALRVLLQMRRIGLNDLARWAVKPDGWGELRASPAAHRADTVRLVGRVLDATQEAIPESAAALFEFRDFYRVAMRLEDGTRVEIISLQTPAAWLSTVSPNGVSPNGVSPRPVSLDEPAAAWGMFFKSQGAAETDAPLFLATRVEWYPVAESVELGVDGNQLALAEMSVDVGLLDQVRLTNERGLQSEDRELFYQLLAVCRRRSAEELRQTRGGVEPLISSPRQPAGAGGGVRSATAGGVARLLSDPKPHQGRLFSLNARARQVTRVAVDDADIRERFGIDHYFQLDCFVELAPGERITFTDRSGKTEGADFEGAYPVTLITAELPGRLREMVARVAGGQTETESLNENLQCTGFFLKLWAYRSEFMESVKKGSRQPSPLFIVAEPGMLTFVPPDRTWIGVIVLALALVATALIWAAIGGRRDRHGSDPAAAMRPTRIQIDEHPREE